MDSSIQKIGGNNVTKVVIDGSSYASVNDKLHEVFKFINCTLHYQHDEGNDIGDLPVTKTP